MGKALRGGNKRKEGGGAIKWDPNDRDSMLRAHGDLREQLVWISKHQAEVDKEVAQLEERRKITHTLTNDAHTESPTNDRTQNPASQMGQEPVAPVGAGACHV